MKRRNFISVAALGIAGLFTSACNFSLANIEDQITKYVPLALAAVSSILAILSGSGISLGAAAIIVPDVIKAFGIVQAAITNWINASAADKSTALGVVATALTSVKGLINQFWSALSIPNAAISTLIESVLQVIVGTLDGYLGKLPPVTSALPSTRKSIVAVPKIISVNDLRKEINGLLIQGGQSQYVLR